MSHHIVVNDTRLEYEVVYSKRRTLSVQVYPNGRVLVRAPKKTKAETIEAFVKGKAAWVLKHQTRFRENPISVPTQRQYIEGECYRYLGGEYHLKIVEGGKEAVRLADDFLVVVLSDTSDKTRSAALINRWYRKEAKRIFAERLAVCFPNVAGWGIEYPKMTIRDMKSRWGSCSAKQKINLNLRLMQVAESLIDYVILHELCHFKEMNHSPAFYALMNDVLPDWRERKKQLNQTPISY